MVIIDKQRCDIMCISPIKFLFFPFFDHFRLCEQKPAIFCQIIADHNI